MKLNMSTLDISRGTNVRRCINQDCNDTMLMTCEFCITWTACVKLVNLCEKCAKNSAHA